MLFYEKIFFFFLLLCLFLMLKDIECKLHDRGAVRFPPLLAKSHESIRVPVEPYDEKDSRESKKQDNCKTIKEPRKEGSESDGYGYSKKFVRDALKKNLKLEKEKPKEKNQKNKKYKEQKTPKNYISDNTQYVTDPDCDNHEKKDSIPLIPKPIITKTAVSPPKNKISRSLKSQSLSRDTEPTRSGFYNYQVSHIPYQAPRPFSLPHTYPTYKPIDIHPTLSALQNPYQSTYPKPPAYSSTSYLNKVSPFRLTNTPVQVHHSYHPLTIHQPIQKNYLPTYTNSYLLPHKQSSAYHQPAITYHTNPAHVNYGTYHHHTSSHPKPTEESHSSSKNHHKKTKEEESEENGSAEEHSEHNQGEEEENHKRGKHGEEQLEKREKSNRSKYHHKNGEDDSNEADEEHEEEYSEEVDEAEEAESERYSEYSEPTEEENGESSDTSGSSPSSSYSSYSSSSDSPTSSSSSEGGEGFSGFDSDFFIYSDDGENDGQEEGESHHSHEESHSSHGGNSGGNSGEKEEDEESTHEEYDREYSYESSESKDSPKRVVYHEKIVTKPTITKPLRRPKTKQSENLTLRQRKTNAKNTNIPKPKTSQTTHSKGNSGNQDLKYFQYFNNFGDGKHTAGGRQGNNRHYIEQHEKSDGKTGLFQKKVRWADKKGGFGEHFWDLNHG